MQRLRSYVEELKDGFVLIGEVLFGDYNLIVNERMLHSCTNYECYKGIYSSFNSMNLFEIAHSLHRQFGPDPWCIYRGKDVYKRQPSFLVKIFCKRITLTFIT